MQIWTRTLLKSDYFIKSGVQTLWRRWDGPDHLQQLEESGQRAWGKPHWWRTPGPTMTCPCSNRGVTFIRRGFSLFIVTWHTSMTHFQNCSFKNAEMLILCKHENWTSMPFLLFFNITICALFCFHATHFNCNFTLLENLLQNTLTYIFVSGLMQFTIFFNEGFKRNHLFI